MNGSSVDTSAIEEAIERQDYELAAKELAKAIAGSLGRQLAREFYALLEKGEIPPGWDAD